ncbi:cell death abnormality protein 1 isoform X3 [Aplysia californica]|uniref:Cell death abnormality protein 1 isoform X3 n=1 Tax=Aplysia californica TaxID=6500 RepID=A0ABM0K0H0_APLCA|nr:cell death abnormality protein 1 isoform X3 [Aplysia californica]
MIVCCRTSPKFISLYFIWFTAIACVIIRHSMSQCLRGSGRIPCTVIVGQVDIKQSVEKHKATCKSYGMRLLELLSTEDKYAMKYFYKVAKNSLQSRSNTVGVLRSKDSDDAYYRSFSGPAFISKSPLWLDGQPDEDVRCVAITSDKVGEVGYEDYSCASQKYALCEACFVPNPTWTSCYFPYKCQFRNDLVCKIFREAKCIPVFFTNKTDYLPCPYNRYGCECESQCHCADNVPCDLYTGVCPAGCKKNWQGPNCNVTKCRVNKFGENCDKFCLCAGDLQCDLETGQCINGCPEGMSDRYCTKSECPPGKYGAECTLDCPCAEGATCDKNSGRCLSDSCLIKTRTLPFCTNISACEVGTYGKECEEKCPCLDGNACERNLGICSNEVCPAIGKGGLDCYDECPKELTCKRCLRLNMTKCGECVEGFRLTPNNTCEKVAGFVAVSASNMWVIILIVVLLIVILVALVDIYIFLQKKDEHSEASQDGEKGLEEQSEQSSEKHEGASDKDEEESMQGSEDEEGDENPQTGEKKESSASSKKHSSASSKKHSSASSKKHSSASSKKQSNASKKQSNVSKMSTVSENLE